MNIFRRFISEIEEYISKNRFMCWIFVIAIIFAITDVFFMSKLPKWKNWEIVAIGYTIVYTIIFYYKMLKKSVFHALSGYQGFLLAFPLFGLVIYAIIMSNEFVPLLRWSTNRIVGLACITIATGSFLFINFFFYHHFNEIAERCIEKKEKEKFVKMKDLFRNSVFMSDLPLTIAFIILTFYCWSLYYYPGEALAEMQPFFSGAIALQMIYSNAIWIFNDDPILEN